MDCETAMISAPAAQNSGVSVLDERINTMPLGRRGRGGGLLAAATVGAAVHHHDQQTMGSGSVAPAAAAQPMTSQGVSRYALRQKFAAIGQDFYVEDMQGRRIMHVDGKAMRVRDTLKFRDAGGNVVYQLQERLMRVRDTMVIERPGGSTAATIRHRMITPLRERFVIEVEGGRRFEATGKFLYAEYRIEENGRHIAEVSKRWFRARDMYGVEIGPGIDHMLILAIAVCIDMMEHEGRV
jgi:uncharacterized protein YxjI